MLSQSMFEIKLRKKIMAAELFRSHYFYSAILQKLNKAFLLHRQLQRQ